MPRWTGEQNLAITASGKNIIVSAGAGSGKTAVLTERVTQKLLKGVYINHLLILTFTNASAFEMKDRIRKSIMKNPDLEAQLSLIDQSYITTFDSFALSMVKKYHYTLNVSKNVQIIDSSLITLEKNRLIDEVFLELYQSNDEDFLTLIRDFCIKDDKDIKESILRINSKIDLRYDKDKYLDSYLDIYYNPDKIKRDVKSYEDLVLLKVKELNNYINPLSETVDSNYFNQVLEIIYPLLEAKTYEDVLNNYHIKLPNLPKNSGDDAKSIKEALNEKIKKIGENLVYTNKDSMEKEILSTYKYTKAIIKIIKILDTRINKFKYENDAYEFTDISKMAIRILHENEDVRLELKSYFTEIMIDEYQDTSDLQEEFISLIENNNVYMVGDIKQSIYRFRNANPLIFKEKYDKYSNNISGMKIDLNKNFRSRRETLDSINVIFNEIMNDVVGGANYKESHQMVFGNTTYEEEGKTTQNNNLEIYNYVYDKDMGFSREEIEIFTIAKDIKNKIDNKYLVFDKNSSTLRPITYKDIVILMDRATKFDLYKRIFEYLGIPLVKHTDTTLTDKDDVKILKNILTLIINTMDHNFDINYSYAYTSIARSYLFRYSDEEIFKSIKEKNYQSTLTNTIIDIIDNMETLSLTEILDLIIEKFNFYLNLIKIGNLESATIRLEYLYNIANSLETLGYDIREFSLYLNKLIEEEVNISVNITENISDCVNIMTIHKSKGLEYPICYYSGIHVSFNISDVTDRFLYDNNYGFITPSYNEGISKTIYNYFFKESYLIDEISEKMRLFYVGLTRSREKMIVVTELNNDKDTSKDILESRSFLDFLKVIKDKLQTYITNVDINTLSLTKNYLRLKSTNYKDSIIPTKEHINTYSVDIKTLVLEKENYSKKAINLFKDKEQKNIELGLRAHAILEELNFKENDLDTFEIDSDLYTIISKIFNVGLDFKNAIIYKEYEFMYDEEHHGIIDLMLEYSDSIKIIDYKLKNIKDEHYLEQVQGYKNYINTKTDKRIETYLYSIVDGKLEKILE